MIFISPGLHYKQGIRAISLLGFVIAILVLSGWLSGTHLISSLLPGKMPMMPWTMVNTLAISVVLFLLSFTKNPDYKRLRLSIVVLTFIPLVTSLVTIFSYFLGLNNPLDTLLFYERLQETPGLSQGTGRMPFPCALAFFSLSLAVGLLLSAQTSVRRHFQLFALIPAILGLQAIVGHIFDIQTLFGMAAYLGMALSTSITLFALSCGFLILEPREGFMRLLSQESPSSQLFRRLGAVLVGAPLLVAIVIRMMETADLVSTDFGLSIFLILTLVALIVFAYIISQRVLESERDRIRLVQEQARREQAEIAQERINAIQRQLQFTLEASNVAFWTWDFGSESISWSGLKDRFFGYREGEMSRTVDNFLQHLNPYDRPALREKIGQAVAGQIKEYEAEYRIRSKDGSLRWHADRGVVTFDDQGHPLRLSGITQDITDKKRSEETLRRSEQRFRLLAHFSETLSLSLNADWIKDRFCRLLAEHLTSWVVLLERNSSGAWVISKVMHACEDLSLPLSQLWGLRTAQMTEAFQVDLAVRTHLSTTGSHLDKAWHPEFFMESRNAPEDFQPMSYITTPLFAHNKTYGCLVAASTCHNFSAEEIELIYELAGRSSLALENAHLFDQIDTAKKAAENANQAKNQFVANVSHEIRTPLGAILGFIDLALEIPNQPAEARDHLLVVKRNAQQLSQLIDEVLDLSKIEADHLKVEKTRFSLPRLLEDVSEIMNFKAKEKGIQYQVITHTPIPKAVISDPLRLRQILINVIGNAIKFTKEGYVRIHLNAEQPRPQKEITLNIEIEDSGIGVSPEQKRRLFQPFSQADTSMTRRFGGTGLGLALSQKLARALGGDLILKESRPGEGSTFQITLPLSPAQQVQWTHDLKSAARPKKVAHPSNKDRLQGVRILLVEDAPDNQQLVTRFLSVAGASVEVANNGLEALNMVDGKKYDAVLMDVQMPIMNGYEATRQLRERGFKPPIIALTAHALSTEKQLAEERGFSGYLTKPIDRNSLIETLDRFTHSSKAVH